MSDYSYGPEYEKARRQFKAAVLMFFKPILGWEAASAPMIIGLAHALEDAADAVKTIYYHRVRAEEEAQFHRENAL